MKVSKTRWKSHFHLVGRGHAFHVWGTGFKPQRRNRLEHWKLAVLATLVVNQSDTNKTNTESLKIKRSREKS